MGHSIPKPYGRIFFNLNEAIAYGIIKPDQAQVTWECVCEAWKRDDPRSYSQ